MIDSIRQELRMPQEKLLCFKHTIQKWRGRKCCRLRELQSLTGLLNHACKVVKPGKVFLGRMFRLAAGVHKPNHRIRLNLEFQSDLEWWHRFLKV